MDFTTTPGLILIYVTCFSSIIFADTCVQKTPCSCEFSNGTGIDLSPAVSSSFYTAEVFSVANSGSQYELSTYYYHPCYDSALNASKSAESTKCGEPLSICRHTNVMTEANTTAKTYTMDNGTYEFLGKTNSSKFSSQGDSIIYVNGPSDTTVLLVCAQSENKLQIYSLAEPDKLVLAFYSRDACLKTIEEISTRSTGSTLLIVFFSFVIFYLTLGICAKKFLMGATGVEVIPNHAFWSDLPNLLKDGWIFMTSGFRLPARTGAGPTIAQDPNSYDSI